MVSSNLQLPAGAHAPTPKNLIDKLFLNNTFKLKTYFVSVG